MIIPPDLGVVLDEESHDYLIPDGSHPPSVTQIMRFMSRELYDGIPFDTLALAADRGTRVHKQTEYLDAFGYAEPDDDTVPYLDAFRAWREAFSPQHIAREWRGYHKQLKYCGTVDWLGYVTPDDGTGIDIVDLKATRQYHRIMLQTQVAGGYKQMLLSHSVPVRHCYGLQLLPDGTYRFERLDDGTKTFLHCLALHNAMAQEMKP